MASGAHGYDHVLRVALMQELLRVPDPSRLTLVLPYRLSTRHRLEDLLRECTEELPAAAAYASALAAMGERAVFARSICDRAIAEGCMLKVPSNAAGRIGVIAPSTHPGLT